MPKLVSTTSIFQAGRHPAPARLACALYPELPEGGTLYCADVPLVLALFNDVNLVPTVSFYYPGVTARRIAAEDVQEVRASLGPDDRIFVPVSPARK